MNRPILIATFGMASTLALHLTGGEFTVHRPLLADGSTPEMDLYISVLWHGISAVIALCTAALAYAAWSKTPQKPLLWLVGGQTCGIGALFILYGLVRTHSLWVAPQWVIIIPLGLLILWTARPTGTNSGVQTRSLT
jgi:hypothetical protein